MFVAWGLTWPSVSAKVVSAEVQEVKVSGKHKSTPRYLLVLTYSYPIGSTVQTNQEIVDQTSPKEDLTAAAARYQDKAIKAYVNPLNAGMSTVNPGQNFANGLIPTILLLMLTGFIFFVKFDTDKKDASCSGADK